MINERGARRDVLNQARRRVERALASEEAAEDMARAAEAVLAAGGPETEQVAALRAAVTRYRRLRGE